MHFITLRHGNLSLQSSLPWVPSRLHVVPITNTRFTRLRACAPYPSIRVFVPLSCFITNTVVSVDPLAKKFNIGRNNHGRTKRCEFSDLDLKHPFCSNLDQKIKIVSLSNLHMQNSMVMFTFSVFDQKYPIWVILVPKI